MLDGTRILIRTRIKRIDTDCFARKTKIRKISVIRVQ